MEFEKKLENHAQWLIRLLDIDRFSYPVRQVSNEEIFWECTGNYLFSQDAAKVPI